MDILKKYIKADKNNFKGQCDPRFQHLAQHFSRLQHDRTSQGGAALAIYYQGEKVVDIFTGQHSSQKAWDEQTLSICYSTGKGVLATLAHILVSHRFLNYDQPIVSFWPEFAQWGKTQMTLRHVLSHQSGLFDIRNVIQQASEMADWSHMLMVMEGAAPRFEIGSQSAYQALTFGWLVGGILEKATQRPLQELFRLYLIEPLQLDGAYFGVPNDQLSRVAKPLNYLDPAQREANEQEKKKRKNNAQYLNSKPPHTAQNKSKTDWIAKAIQWSGQNPQDFMDAMVPKGMKHFSFFDDESIQAIIPAANGVFNARSLAKIYAMLAQKGQWDGVELIDPATFAALSIIQSQKRDRVMPIPMQWRLGYHRVLTLGKRSKGFGHIGYNGSGAWCDPDRELSFAYIHNFPTGSITGDYRLWSLSQETLRCADLLRHGKKGWF